MNAMPCPSKNGTLTVRSTDTAFYKCNRFEASKLDDRILVSDELRWKRNSDLNALIFEMI